MLLLENTQWKSLRDWGDYVHLNAAQPSISMKPNDARRLNNEQSGRDLPIPSEVIRVGLAAYSEAIRESGT
jgi:hypothetical protein